MAFVDLALSADGDLLTERGDLKLVSGDDYRRQQVLIRLKSIRVNWRYDHIGADLESIIGKPNTQDTAKEGIDLIVQALTEDGLFKAEELYVKPVPLNKSAILFFVFVNTVGDPMSFVVEIDLQAGVIVREG